MRLVLILLLSVFIAQSGLSDQATSMTIAQFDGDDAYDPFADYSEFEDASDEEADINFFRNGRFFTLGFVVGHRRFTSVMSTIYSPGVSFGGYISYFFDLRFAMQVGYMVGDHIFRLNTPTQNFEGKVSVSSTSFHLKYYLNTQNVTRGLASLNPYLLGGLVQTYRTAQVLGTSAYTRDAGVGFEGGAGLEIPIMRHQMYLGLQAVYQFVNFADENIEIAFQDPNSGNPVRTGIYPRGDIIHFTGILGINF